MTFGCCHPGPRAGVHSHDTRSALVTPHWMRGPRFSHREAHLKTWIPGRARDDKNTRDDISEGTDLI